AKKGFSLIFSTVDFSIFFLSLKIIDGFSSDNTTYYNCSGLLTSCPGPGFVPIATMRYSGHHETLHSHHLLPIDFENTEVLDVQFVLPPGIMRWPLFL
ncbi:MAG: hypothetical protein KAQ71_19235, partial [Desulfobulbaceae bacterium]|nr:hypothetical protein [Desulfobulbaceae bacterium]